jgi:hypothetical protein
MFKRIVMGAGLSLAMLGGVAGATHSSGTVSAHPATHAVAAAGVKAVTAEIQTADAASTAPCTVDAAGNEDGNCQDSQNTSGPADSAGTGVGEATTPDGEAATPETDTVQAGGQTQSGSQVGGNN